MPPSMYTSFHPNSLSAQPRLLRTVFSSVRDFTHYGFILSLLFFRPLFLRSQLRPALVGVLGMREVS